MLIRLKVVRAPDAAKCIPFGQKGKVDGQLKQGEHSFKIFSRRSFLVTDVTRGELPVAEFKK